MRDPAETADRCGPAWWDQASAKDPPLQHPPKPHQHLRQHCEQLLALSSSQLAHFLRQCRLVRGVIGQYFAGLLSPTLRTNIILGILPVEGTKRPILVLRAVINSWLNTQSFEKPGFCASWHGSVKTTCFKINTSTLSIKCCRHLHSTSNLRKNINSENV